MLDLTCLAVGGEYQTSVVSCLPRDKTLAGGSIEALVKAPHHIQVASRGGANVSLYEYSLFDLVVALRHASCQHG